MQIQSRNNTHTRSLLDQNVSAKIEQPNIVALVAGQEAWREVQQVKDSATNVA